VQYPSPLNYGKFPKSVCTSVNECVCHGIPDDRPLQEVCVCVSCEFGEGDVCVRACVRRLRLGRGAYVHMLL
jgi:methionine aminopeptidase